jgi:thiamine pyrophosphate-dependent enzyme
MNGARSLVQTLVNCGVDTCFANPGTSEMHLVAAFDTVAGLRPVLCLFEGVATGAADGYGRVAGKPAVTLLHWDRVWPMAWPICITPAVRPRRSSISSAITPPITCNTMHC